jgi:catechol 2,3-dioxygenase-like lactoylglutathione lyase family enzyme
MLTNAPVVPILLTKDLEASKRFYADQLGLPIETESDSEVTFAWGGQPRLRLSASTVGTKDSQTQLAWIVDDLRAEVDALRQRGVTIEEYDSDELKTVDGIADQGEAFVAWITDPGGNVVAVEQLK